MTLQADYLSFVI